MENNLGQVKRVMLALTKIQETIPGWLCVKTGVAERPTEEERLLHASLPSCGPRLGGLVGQRFGIKE